MNDKVSEKFKIKANGSNDIQGNGSTYTNKLNS